MDLEKFRENLIKICRLEKDSPILVGVSGGPDSLCLLDLLHSAGFFPVAAVFDHQLRPSSVREVQFVSEFSAHLNTAFFTAKSDVRDYAEKKKLSIEEAARICRYRFLFEKAREISAQAVAVAHHADDQIETVLMHFLRGSGMRGLRGMEYRQISEWDQKIPIVRPLLDFRKEEIEIYCEEKGFSPVRDETNLDNDYFRNRIRNELIPILRDYNPGIKDVIWRTADTIREDEKFLNQLTEDYWEKLDKKTGPGFILFETKQLSLCPKGLQRRLVRKALSTIKPGLQDIGFDMVTGVLEFLEKPTRSSRMELPAELKLLLKDGQLFIGEKYENLPFLQEIPQIGAQDLFKLDIPGKLALMGNWVLSAEIFSEKASSEVTGYKENPFEVFLDAEMLAGQLFLRSRRAGDRFQPFGMGGRTQKISDFFINEKMTREARDHWPLVLSENKIVWIPGCRTADFCRVKESTRKVLLLKLSKTY